MSPGIRRRVWASCWEAAQREPEGSPHKVRLKAMAYLMAYGGGMNQLAGSLYRLTRPERD